MTLPGRFCIETSEQMQQDAAMMYSVQIGLPEDHRNLEFEEGGSEGDLQAVARWQALPNGQTESSRSMPWKVPLQAHLETFHHLSGLL